MKFVYAQTEKFSASYDQHLKVYQSTFLLKVQSKFKPSKSNISSSLLTELEFKLIINYSSCPYTLLHPPE